MHSSERNRFSGRIGSRRSRDQGGCRDLTHHFRFGGEHLSQTKWPTPEETSAPEIDLEPDPDIVQTNTDRIGAFCLSQQTFKVKEDIEPTISGQEAGVIRCAVDLFVHQEVGLILDIGDRDKVDQEIVYGKDTARLELELQIDRRELAASNGRHFTPVFRINGPEEPGSSECTPIESVLEPQALVNLIVAVDNFQSHTT